MSRIIAILIFVLLSSCQKKENDLKFEKSVMNEIFIDLVDSVYENLNFIPPPPPPYPEIYYKTNNQKIKDSIVKTTAENYEKSIKELNQRIEKLKKENNKIIIAIVDTINSLSENYKIKLIEQYGKLDFNIDTNSIKTEYKINLTDFNKTSKYLFRYSSEFPKNSEIWRWKFENNYDLKAVISFSRILFDKNKEFGVLMGGIAYGKLNGNGVLIFIKKESDKWIIDKIIETWIS